MIQKRRFAIGYYALLYIQFFLSIQLFLFSSSAYSISDTIQLSDIMTEQESKDIGLTTFSSDQKKIFILWLEKWTQQVIQQADTYHPSMSFSQWIHTWPIYAKPGAKESDRQVQQSRKNANLKIFRNENGKKLELQDGSIWHILSFDCPTSLYWQRDNTIQIEKKPRDLMRPYILLNTSRNNEQVGAKMIQEACYNFVRAQDPASYFAGAFCLSSIHEQTGDITLSDTDSHTFPWKIAPIHQAIVISNWKKNDRIRVVKKSDLIWQYSLSNLDSGDTVSAKKSTK